MLTVFMLTVMAWFKVKQFHGEVLLLREKYFEFIQLLML